MKRNTSLLPIFAGGFVSFVELPIDNVAAVVVDWVGWTIMSCSAAPYESFVTH